MGVTKWPRKRSTRKSVKARRPWSRTVATYRVPRPPEHILVLVPVMEYMD